MCSWDGDGEKRSGPGEQRASDDPEGVANTIIAAGDELLNNGKRMDQFPVDVYQGGAGTSVNMNTNEVLRTSAWSRLATRRGIPVPEPERPRQQMPVHQRCLPNRLPHRGVHLYSEADRRD
ncbi:lyase family protein [Escherichia coli]